MVLLEKGAYPNEDRSRLTPFDIKADIDDGLARLKFDYLDVFALHRDDKTVPVGLLWKFLNEYKKWFNQFNWFSK